jgi:hypothetical protein
MRGDLADHYAQSLCDRGLTSDPSVRILRQHAIEHRIRDLVADLVRVAFRYRFRGEKE